MKSCSRILKLLVVVGLISLGIFYGSRRPWLSLPEERGASRLLTRCVAAQAGAQEYDQIETLYGTFDIGPLVKDLLASQTMQRLKKVNQYGVWYYMRHGSDPKKLYTRYEHSVGVWALLKRYGAAVKEQIAGLLHDASHTVFSHVGDFVFKQRLGKDSYQDNIHNWYLDQGDAACILASYDIKIPEINHKSNDFALLEQPYPDLNADRLEYNLKGGLIENLIDEQDIEIILGDLTHEDGRWFFKTPRIAAQLAYVSLRLNKQEWGSIGNYVCYSWAARALWRAMEINEISEDEVHFSTDDIIWDRLLSSTDHVVQDNLKKMFDYDTLCTEGSHDDHDHFICTKFTGLDPLVKQGNALVRLTSIDHAYAQAYEGTKNHVAARYIKMSGRLAGNKDEFKECVT